MATTLFQATLALAKILGEVIEGDTTATGTVTTLIDTGLSRFPVGFFTNGLLWIQEGDLANTLLTITAFTPNSGTLTFATQASAPGSAKLYAAMPNIVSQYELRLAINQALTALGQVPTQNTSLTTVADQQAYTLPAGVSRINKVEVTYDSTAPKQWQLNSHWQEIGGEIVFDYGYQYGTAGYTIRLSYMADHAFLDDLTDEINSNIHINVVKWAALLELAKVKLFTSPSDKRWTNSALVAQDALAKARKRHPIKILQPHHHFPDYGALFDD